jgi:acetoin utilization deacetylase AcuC-like enzyme
MPDRPQQSEPRPALRAFHHPGFEIPIGPHIMPMRKFGLVAAHAASLPGVQIERPEPATEADLLRVHAPSYLAAVRTGRPTALAESQKFPWVPELWSSVRLANGAVIEAAAAALEDGVAAAVASGFHHACHDHGEGFCTFNGLVVAAERLRAEGRLRTVAILDLDLHYGNGTAELAASRPWLKVLSIYGNDYHANRTFRDVTQRHHEDGPNHRSQSLPAGCQREELLRTLASETPWLWTPETPDLILYQAGADPFREDPYSPLDLGIEDLKARDRWVFERARERRIPIAWVLAGGYTREIEKVVEIHMNTFRSALEVFHG